MPLTIPDELKPELLQLATQNFDNGKAALKAAKVGKIDLKYTKTI